MRKLGGNLVFWILPVVVLVAAAVALRELPGRAPGIDRRLRAPSGSMGEEVPNTSTNFGIERVDLDIKDCLEVIERGFEARDPAAVLERIAGSFEGSVPDSFAPAGESVAVRESGEAGLRVRGREELAAALGRLFDSFDLIYESLFKVKHYEEVRTLWVIAEVKQDLRGRRKDGSLHQEFLRWKCAFRKREGGWFLARAFVASRREMTAAAPLFREVTSAAGLYRKEPPDLSVVGVDAIFNTEADFSNYDYGGVCVYDVDGDGLLDVFMSNAYGNPALFINRGDGTFADEAAKRGIVAAGGGRGAVFGDVDNDGDPDLYVCRSIFHHPRIQHTTNLFFENTGGGRFVNRTREAGLFKVTPSMSATFLDYDLDGDLDLFVGCYGRGGINHQFHATNGNPSLLYRNDGDGTFTDVSSEAGVGKETYWSYAVSVCDVNKDRYPDIYVANDYGPNQLYMNQGNGTFRDRAEELGVVDVGNGMGATFVDWNHDRAWDLYVTNMQSGTGQRVLTVMKDLVSEGVFANLWKLTLGNSFFAGDGRGGFGSRLSGDLGISNCGWSWNADFADFDADADLDLVVVNGYFSGVKRKDC